jgi:hypothetical protein
MEQLGFPWTDCDNTWYLGIFFSFENLSKKFKLYLNPTRIKGTLHEEVNTFITISRYVLLKMRIVLDKRCRENQNTHFMLNKFSRKSCSLWGDVKKCGGDRKTTNDGMHTPKHPGTHTHTPTRAQAHTDKNVILLFNGNCDQRARLTVPLYVRCLPCFQLLFITQTTSKIFSFLGTWWGWVCSWQ